MKELQIKIDTSKSIRSIKSLEDEIADLKKEISTVDDKASFDKLSKQIAQATSELKNMELAFEGLDSEQKAAELGSVAGAVGDITAAFVLLGGENDTLKQIAGNIEKAMGISMAFKGAIEGISSARKLMNNSTLVSNTLEQISIFIKGESAAASAAMAAGEAARATATVGAATATGVATTMLKAFRIALVATGIGAIVVGLGLLIANFDLVSEAVMKAVNWLKEMYYKFQNLGAGVKIAISIMFPFIGMVYAMAEALEYFGVIESEEEMKFRKMMEEKMALANEEYNQSTEIIKDKIADIKYYREQQKKVEAEQIAAIDWEIEKKKAAGEDYKELEKEKLQYIIDTVKADIVAKKAQIAAEFELRDARLQVEKEQREAKGESTKAIDALQDKNSKKARNYQDEELDNLLLNLTEAEHALELFNIKTDTDAKKTSDNKVNYYKNAQEEITKIDRKSNEISTELETEKATGALEAYRKQWDERIDLMDEGFAKEKEALLEQLTFGEISYAQYEKRLTELKQEETQRRIDVAGEYFSQINSMTQGIFEFANNIGKQDEKSQEQRAKRQFNIQKGLNVAEVGIDTAKGIAKAVAASPATFGLPFSAFVGATGLAQIAAILSKRFEPSGGGASGGGASASVPSAPQTATLNQSTLFGTGGNPNELVSSSVTGGSEKSTRVYVLEADITNSQATVANIEDRATL